MAEAPPRHNKKYQRIQTYIPQDTKVGLDKMLYLLDITESEALSEALYAYLPVLLQRVNTIKEARGLPSIYPQ